MINKYIKKYSLNGFYNNIILRKICCHIRKIDSINNILNNSPLWINGYSKYQSLNRKKNNYDYEYDLNRKIIKCNLLLNWSFKDIFYFNEKFNILNNIMYNLGYLSIGCEPCTITSQNIINLRSGRWWWEIKNTKKECGLHN